jgi:quercetin dioxygenase-like cupin family protein
LDVWTFAGFGCAVETCHFPLNSGVFRCFSESFQDFAPGHDDIEWVANFGIASPLMEGFIMICTFTLQNRTQLRNLAAGLTLGLIALGAGAADELPEGGVRITTDELVWKPGRVPGHEIAALIGDSSKPGPYVERVKFPPNSISQAHSHPEARAYTIISGTWYVGYGDRFDLAKLKMLPAGSFYTEPANVNHFSQIKEDGVVVQIVGNGPTATRFFAPPAAPQK